MSRRLSVGRNALWAACGVVLLGIVMVASLSIWFKSHIGSGPLGPYSAFVAVDDGADSRWIAYTRLAPEGECVAANSADPGGKFPVDSKSPTWETRLAGIMGTGQWDMAECDFSDGAVSVPPLPSEARLWEIGEQTTQVVLLNAARDSNGLFHPHSLVGQTPGYEYVGTADQSMYFGAIERLMPRSWHIAEDGVTPVYETIGEKCLVVRGDKRLGVEPYTLSCARVMDNDRANRNMESED